MPRVDGPLVASLVYGTSTYQAAARQINLLSDENARLRRALEAYEAARWAAAYSNYQPRPPVEQTRP